MKLSIIIPVFNEEQTVMTVINTVRRVDIGSWKKEIIVVDDGSTDNTVKNIKKVLSGVSDTLLISHKENQGKGTAVRSAIAKSSGEYILIQDADLEYDPADIPRLLRPLKEKKAEVVYGTRLKRWPDLKRDESRPQFLLHYLGNRGLSLLTSLMYGQSLTDLETGYKIFPRKAVQSMKLTAQGFEFEPEITIKLIRQGYRIYEVPIKTTPRGYEKGKKLRTIPDGIKALMTIIKYR